MRQHFTNSCPKDVAVLLKALWSEEDVQGVTTSCQYVLELWERLDETMKLAQAELEKNQVRNKKLYNQKVKKRLDETMKLAQAELEKNQVRNKKLYNQKVKSF